MKDKPKNLEIILLKRLVNTKKPVEGATVVVYGQEVKIEQY